MAKLAFYNGMSSFFVIFLCAWCKKQPIVFALLLKKSTFAALNRKRDALFV
jgi:hypothetical protein